MTSVKVHVLRCCLLTLLVAALPLSAATFTWSTTLSQAEETTILVPSSATGFATGLLNTDTNLLTWSISFAGLTADLGAAHFHSVPPDPGPVRVGITVPGGTGMGDLLVGSFTAASDAAAVSGTPAMTWAEFETAFLAGQVYVNLHTSNNPGGEIRGNIEAGDIALIPEPATFTLMGAGLAALVVIPRRRKV